MKWDSNRSILSGYRLQELVFFHNIFLWTVYRNLPCLYWWSSTNLQSNILSITNSFTILSLDVLVLLRLCTCYPDQAYTVYWFSLPIPSHFLSISFTSSLSLCAYLLFNNFLIFFLAVFQKVNIYWDYWRDHAVDCKCEGNRM